MCRDHQRIFYSTGSDCRDPKPEDSEAMGLLDDAVERQFDGRFWIILWDFERDGCGVVTHGLSSVPGWVQLIQIIDNRFQRRKYWDLSESVWKFPQKVDASYRWGWGGDGLRRNWERNLCHRNLGRRRSGLWNSHGIGYDEPPYNSPTPLCCPVCLEHVAHIDVVPCPVNHQRTRWLLREVRSLECFGISDGETMP